MDLVGELVISEAMVTSNPDLKGLSLENFNKAASQLKKITSELQDIVMSIRMVPLSATFQKMNRIVRDMCKKLDKDVDLEILGEETEVDKNIIENISDPLMHLIRNSIDHGIETREERIKNGKSLKGKITLEAKNEGGEVIIIVKDDGRGLNKEKILQKAIDNGLIQDTNKDISDREVFSMIFLPGFSTKENVTEFSGRGVGMDVVSNNIEKIGGAVNVDSTVGEGTTMTIRIPLTLAIIDGMNIRVSNSTYTIPITSIKESFRVKEDELITDPDGNEMIMVRGDCYPILRMHKLFNIKDSISNISEGITIMVESEMDTVCLFADELLGEQQVVVKALPQYIKKVKGIAGCTLLGEGTISLILDIAALVKGR
ncbi:putative CheA signal transduction histidine kinase [Pseudobacteroides cellulosolvens ATCC 35603 = DSM 2933]|uniref:Chemotaxis protein CheA n=2 Tax=Pseudobacteroides cellulosolvens TaxID=35825 RepID=A0A0L6JNC2_9FIRM|nr:putative CheA signal transduction histidine kinase [Pseudobacteroides cellulosolvens ATCC 35603 = DSM 2933]